MKIGIVTLIGEFNYGNLLQSYALQTILERLGHQPIVLNRRCANPNIRPYCLRILSFVKSLILRFFLNRKDLLLVNPFEEDYDTRMRTNKMHLKQFIRKYINRSKSLHSSNDIKKYIDRESFDAFVVGSDQVWRECYTFSIEEMFLSFLSQNSSAKRIAYAASFGVDEDYISEEKMPLCKDLLKRFDAVSVREKSAVKICKEHFGVEAKHVLDPTMLLSVEDYKKLFIENNTPKSKGNLLVYILDDRFEIKQVISKYSEDKKQVPFSVNELEKVNSISYTNKLPTLEAWLRGFHDAECVITDSFHACVFSILFNKPFVCIGNKSRGNARFDSLLGLFELESRLVEDLSNIEEIMLNPINWDRVNKILKEKRKEANEFIVNALK